MIILILKYHHKKKIITKIKLDHAHKTLSTVLDMRELHGQSLFLLNITCNMIMKALLNFKMLKSHLAQNHKQ